MNIQLKLVEIKLAEILMHLGEWMHIHTEHVKKYKNFQSPEIFFFFLVTEKPEPDNFKFKLEGPFFIMAPFNVEYAETARQKIKIDN